MRFKIIAYTFSVPFVWLTLLLIKYYAPNVIPQFFSSTMLMGLFWGSFVIRLLVHSKYLTALTIDKNVVEITYLTSVGKQRQTTFLLDTITGIKVKKKLLFIRDFDTLILFENYNKNSFLVYSSGLNQAIELLMQNISDRQFLKKE